MMTIWKYVYDKRMWIIFQLIVLGLLNVLFFVDNAIILHRDALIYMNVLYVAFGIGFLVWRYRMEKPYYKALIEIVQDPAIDVLAQLPSPDTYEQQLTHQFVEALVKQYQQTLSETKRAYLDQTEFIHAWVHEVKAPLTAMKLTLDANRHDPAMRKVAADWTRIHLLIDEHLHLSRLSSLDRDYLVQQVDAESLIIQEVKTLSSWCLEKNIAVEIDGSNPSILTDEKWARFVFRQLLTNAVKYSPEGSVITIESGVEDNIPYISIQDEGRGIAAQDLPRIFDKGFTGQTGRKQNAATGIGLYIAHMIGEKINITIHIDSTVDVGTTAILSFSKPNHYDSLTT